ncbi:hypothetical protein MAR_003234, partial [Mya arenaria]
MIRNLKPSEIFYSQDSINNVFDRRSQHWNIRIGETLDDICDGRCSVLSIPQIAVKSEGEKWVTADNRRLWVFKQLERLGKIETINVYIIEYIPPAKMTSNNGGVSIRVRGAPGGRWYLEPDKLSKQKEQKTYLLNAHSGSVTTNLRNTNRRPTTACSEPNKNNIDSLLEKSSFMYKPSSANQYVQDVLPKQRHLAIIREDEGHNKRENKPSPTARQS